MKPWMKALGLTLKGAKLAPRALEHAIALLRVCGGDEDFAGRIQREANFRENVLPGRTITFRRKYKKDSGL